MTLEMESVQNYLCIVKRLFVNTASLIYIKSSQIAKKIPNNTF